MYTRVIQEKKERARLRGRAFGVMRGDGEVPVDGEYEVSTVSIFGDRTHTRETIAFKVSGIGPDQIEEPYRVETLVASDEPRRLFRVTFR